MRECETERVGTRELRGGWRERTPRERESPTLPSRPRRDTESPLAEQAPTQPFVKWAGGKRRLVPALAPYFPDEIGTYWEPFVGGAAVFFAFARRIKHAVLSDTNEELVLTYQIVKSDVEALIEQLRLHKRKHDKRAGQTYEDGKTYYRRVRDAEPTEPVEIAARFLYLNKTCYNGLYRVNSKGKFNVPEGRYKNPDICNADRLRETSQVLQNATIRVGDFTSIVQPSRNDFVYCDPPYDGVFTSYQASGFGGERPGAPAQCRKRMDTKRSQGRAEQRRHPGHAQALQRLSDPRGNGSATHQLQGNRPRQCRRAHHHQ